MGSKGRIAGCGEGGRQARSGGDSDLRKDALQVIADGPMRQIEPCPDDLVGMPLSGELSDVQLLRGQVLPDLRGPTQACLARGSQFLPRAIAPGRGAKGVKNSACLAQRRPRIGGASLPAQPAAIGEQETAS